MTNRSGLDWRITDLPGIGRKYQLKTCSGDDLIVVTHNDGRRELYRISPGSGGDVCAIATLEDDESALLSGILGGLTYRPKALDTSDAELQDLVIEWIHIEPSYHCLGKRIGELDIRSRTGAAVIAILDRKGLYRIHPGPDDTFTVRSTVVIAGERRQIKALKQLLASGIDGYN
jgi:Putative regulatory, ligand-binding protein related to C-terminal domains of K+ channels